MEVCETNAEALEARSGLLADNCGLVAVIAGSPSGSIVIILTSQRISVMLCGTQHNTEKKKTLIQQIKLSVDSASLK